MPVVHGPSGTNRWNPPKRVDSTNVPGSDGSISPGNPTNTPLPTTRDSIQNFSQFEKTVSITTAGKKAELVVIDTFGNSGEADDEEYDFLSCVYDIQVNAINRTARPPFIIVPLLVVGDSAFALDDNKESALGDPLAILAEAQTAGQYTYRQFREIIGKLDYPGNLRNCRGSVHLNLTKALNRYHRAKTKNRLLGTELPIVKLVLIIFDDDASDTIACDGTVRSSYVFRKIKQNLI